MGCANSHLPSQSFLKATSHKSSNTDNPPVTAEIWKRARRHTNRPSSKHLRKYCGDFSITLSRLWQILRQHVLESFLGVASRKMQCQRWQCISRSKPCPVWIVREPTGLYQSARVKGDGSRRHVCRTVSLRLTSLTTIPPRLWAINSIRRRSQP